MITIDIDQPLGALLGIAMVLGVWDMLRFVVALLRALMGRTEGGQ